MEGLIFGILRYLTLKKKPTDMYFSGKRIFLKGQLMSL